MTMASRLRHSTPSASQRRRAPVMTRSAARGRRAARAARPSRAVTTSAPLEPNTVALRLDVDADRRWRSPSRAPTARSARAPRGRRRARAARDACAVPIDEAADRALHDELGEARCRSRRRPRPSASPTAGRAVVAAIQRRAAGPCPAHPPRLDRAEDGAGDGAADQRCAEGVDGTGDELGDEAADREAEERRQPAQRAGPARPRS